ncbi:MAG: retropepsin-like aspartic protease [Pyrinomonadaceae bacterium]
MTSSGFLSSEVKLDGIDATQNFIVDTGASISVVSEALRAREEMGRFMQTTRIKVYGAAGITENVSALIIPKMTVGLHSRSVVPAVILDLEPINETTGFEQTGIIGGNFLRNYRMTIDFQRAILRLEPVSPAAAAPAPQHTGNKSTASPAAATAAPKN